MAETQKTAEFDTKETLKSNVGKKVNLSDRMNVEIVKSTKHYKAGQKVSPHKVIAEGLIKQGIAKEIKN